MQNLICIPNSHTCSHTHTKNTCTQFYFFYTGHSSYRILKLWKWNWPNFEVIDFFLYYNLVEICILVKCWCAWRNVMKLLWHLDYEIMLTSMFLKYTVAEGSLQKIVLIPCRNIDAEIYFRTTWLQKKMTSIDLDKNICKKKHTENYFRAHH